MTERFNFHGCVSRCDAAVCSSVRIRPILDAAILLAVSVCVVCLRIILQTA